MSGTAGRWGRLVALLWCIAAPVSAQDALQTLRALYEDAAYRDALALGNGLRADAADGAERALVERYRALCLFALQEPDDAHAALELMIRHDPLLQPGEADLPPRVQRAMEEARRRLLPEIARDSYAAGKHAYERRDHAAALDALDRAVAVADAATTLGVAADQLSDLRMLAVGFRDLAAYAMAAGAPADARAVGTSGPAEPADAGRATTAAPNVAPPPGASPPAVTPPRVLKQQLPPWPSALAALAGSRPAGLLEVTIGATGEVEHARMRQPIHPQYDHLVLTASRLWRYEPALRNGVPVPYVKLIRIDIAEP